MRVLVTGGTGRLARHLFRRPAASRFGWRILSRRPPPPGEARDWAVGDLRTGAGLEAALAGTDAVLHLASDLADSASDVEGTRQLVRAASAARVGHLLFLSIIGVDRIPYRYYRHKHAAEAVISAGGVPWTILRAAQFHSFIDELLTRVATIPLVMPVPLGFRVQSVADAEMAERLVAGLQAGPAGTVQEFAGPEILTVRQAAATWRRLRGVPRLAVPVPIPGAAGAAFRAGYNTSPDAERSSITWTSWLEASARQRPAA